MKWDDPVTPAVACSVLMQWVALFTPAVLVPLTFSPSRDCYLIALGIMSLLFLLGRKVKGAESVQGSGSQFYGHKPTTNGFITTKWITVWHWPLIPLRSYEVFSVTIPESHNIDFEDPYKFPFYHAERQLSVRLLPKLFWPQVAKGAVCPFISFIAAPAFFRLVFGPH
jgi:hypothetical protein